MPSPASFICGLLISAALLAMPNDAFAQRAAGVVVAPVKEQEFAETTPVIGRLVSATRSVLASRVVGIVASVSVSVGDRVEKGAEIARLDQTRLSIEREQAEAALAQSRALVDVALANLQLAEQGFARMNKLKGSAAFSTGRFDDLQSEVARARSNQVEAAARLRNAEAELSLTDYNLTHTQILAPFDGVIVERQAQPGQYVALGAPVATLLDISDLEVEADVPADIARLLEVGREAQVQIEPGVWTSAVVRAVIPNEAVTTQTRPVRFSITLADDDASVAAGQSVTLKIPSGAPQKVMTVPKDAIVQSGGGWTVMIANEGVAERRAVTIGRAVGDGFVVLSGLKEGEMVVVRGNERLRPGQKIQATGQGG